MKEDELTTPQKEIVDEALDRYLLAIKKDGFDGMIKLFVYDVRIYYLILHDCLGMSPEECKNQVHEIVDVALNDPPNERPNKEEVN